MRKEFTMGLARRKAPVYIKGCVERSHIMLGIMLRGCERNVLDVVKD